MMPLEVEASWESRDVEEIWTSGNRSIRNSFVQGEEEELERNGTEIYQKLYSGHTTSDIVLTAALSFLSVFSNLFVLLMICLVKKYRRPVNFLMANLSLSSLLFSASLAISLLEKWTGLIDLDNYTGKFFCPLTTVLHRIPLPIISLTTTVLSLDRSKVARNPLQRTGTFRIVRQILEIWLFSILISIPLALSRSYDPMIQGTNKCIKVLMLDSVYFHLGYGITCVLFVHLFPACILLRELVRTIFQIKFLSSNPEQNGEFLTERKMTLLRNSGIFAVIFMVVWFPFGIFRFLLDLPKELIPSIDFQKEVLSHWAYFRFVIYVQVSFGPFLLLLLSYDAKNSPCNWPWCRKTYYNY